MLRLGPFTETTTTVSASILIHASYPPRPYSLSELAQDCDCTVGEMNGAVRALSKCGAATHRGDASEPANIEINKDVAAICRDIVRNGNVPIAGPGFGVNGDEYTVVAELRRFGVGGREVRILKYHVIKKANGNGNGTPTE